MNLLAISEHCIFPLEEKGKRRRRRKEKKRVVREGRTGRAWATLGKVDRAKMQGSQGHIPARAQRRPLPVRREERACGKPDSLPLGGLDDPARGAQVRRERRVKRCAGTRSFSTRIRNLNMRYNPFPSVVEKYPKQSHPRTLPIGGFHVVERKRCEERKADIWKPFSGREEEDGLENRWPFLRGKRNDLFRQEPISCRLIWKGVMEIRRVTC